MVDDIGNIFPEFNLQQFLATIIFLIFGIYILGYTGFFSITSFDAFCLYFNNKAVEGIYSFIIIFIALYYYISVYKNFIAKPKKVVLYLVDKDDNMLCRFIDKKGKVFYFADNNYTIGEYYSVFKRQYNICKIGDVSSDRFDILNFDKSSKEIITGGLKGKIDLVLPFVYLLFLFLLVGYTFIILFIIF